MVDNCNMSKLTNEKKKQLAERFYINEGKTGKWISEYLEVTEATITRWKKGDPKNPLNRDWDIRKAETLSAPHKIKELTFRAMLQVAEGKVPEVDADSLVKYANTIQKIDKQIGIQVMVTVIMELDKYIASESPELALAYARLHQKFIHKKASETV